MAAQIACEAVPRTGRITVYAGLNLAQCDELDTAQCARARRAFRLGGLNPQPSTLNPSSGTLVRSSGMPSTRSQPLCRVNRLVVAVGPRPKVKDK